MKVSIEQGFGAGIAIFNRNWNEASLLATRANLQVKLSRIADGTACAELGVNSCVSVVRVRLILSDGSAGAVWLIVCECV